MLKSPILASGQVLVIMFAIHCDVSLRRSLTIPRPVTAQPLVTMACRYSYSSASCEMEIRLPWYHIITLQGLVHSVCTPLRGSSSYFNAVYKYISCLNWTAPTVSTTTPAITSTTQKWSRLTRPPQHSSPYLRVNTCWGGCLQRSSMSGASKKRFPSLLAISWEKPWQRDSGGRGRWWQHKQQPFLSTTFLRVCVCQNSARKSENKYNCVQI